MALVLHTGPALEPVTLLDAKAHLRVDESDDDTLISSLITAARIHVEAVLSGALITQVWQQVLDSWPRGSVHELPLSPVQSVNSINTYDSEDAPIVFDPSHYFADTVSQPSRLILRGAQAWPKPGRVANGIEITFTAGYGVSPGDIPEPIRQALMLLVAHWYENREPIALGVQATQVPATVNSLILPYRRLYW